MKVKSQEPSNPAVYATLGYSYHHLGEAEKSIDSFNKGLSIAPQSSNLWYGLGLATLQQGDTISAYC